MSETAALDRREDAAVLAPSEVRDRLVIDRDGLAALLVALRADHRLLGPTVRDGAVVLDDINGFDDLPAGWGDEQSGGTYRLRRRDDERLFGWAVGAHSWKAHLFPPRTTLWSAIRTDGGFAVQEPADDVRPMAFFGVRGCDLHAIAVQDRVFLGGEHPDPIYARRRAELLLVAVNCSEPASTCFCPSMGTGPGIVGGADLVLTELSDDTGHRFLVEVCTTAGETVLEGIDAAPATEDDRRSASAVTIRAEARITRRLETDGIRDLLLHNLEHPRWDDVAERCLACTNCTLVCPTCFCSTVEDHTDLTGEHAERTRRWDSCFTLDHSYLHGGSVRSTHRARYRQWMTHKLATWVDQFGSSGCVGCGRCTTWCPVAIDITEEAAAIRAAPREPEVAMPAVGRFR